MSAAGPTILQIIPQLDTGGAERSTIEMAEAVARSGGRALVASQGGRMESALSAAGGELVRFPAATKNPLKLRKNAVALAALIRREGVSLVHARSRAPAWSALWAGRRTGCPFVTTYHGAYNESGPLKRLYNSVMVRSDVVIANSHYTADLIGSRYGEPKGELVVIHRGVDLDVFDPDKVSGDRIHALFAGWGLKPDHRVILQAARLTGWKGQSDVIDAVARLASSGRLGDDVRVVLIGDAQGRADYRSQLEARIVASGLERVISMPGHCSDMPAAFAGAVLAVVASNEPEAFGRAAVEAQAMGCPVISTNIGAPPETVKALPAFGRDERTGWLVAPSDPEQIAGAIHDALSLEQDELCAMRARCLAHARGNFSIANMQLATLAIYDRLLGSHLADYFTTSS